ncbi:MAG TPA: FAD-binding protein [Acidobacteriaceae bacterium]|nr:FAD-binding protein [Acidobacteriaceae bacterium]
MDKREFLKTGGAFLTGSLLSRMASGSQANPPRTNWSGNYRFHAEKLYQPETLAQVQETVKSCSKLRALGSRHSFNGIADSTSSQISLHHLDAIVLDPKARTVTVGGGVTYDKLAPWLDAHGFALPNLASLTEITVPGACATATHGSGNHNGNLATPVSAMEIVTAGGEVSHLSRERDGAAFLGAVIGLGGLGVVTRITLDVLPTFQVRQAVYENLSIDQLKDHLNDVFASGYSVSLFTDWQHHRIGQVWVKSRVEPGSASALPRELFGATLAKTRLHPIPGHSAESCTEQMGIPGPWFERLPHFRIGFTPSAGAELQSEFFIPREKGYEAILAVEELRDHITPHLYVSELRTIAADSFWMSPCYQRPSMTIHFTWKPETAAVMNVLPMIEAKLAPFHARPHWAKLFTMPPAHIQSLYAKLPDFRALLQHYDPQGKFRNAFLNTNLWNA